MNVVRKDRAGFFRSEPVIFNGVAVAKDRPWWQRAFGIDRRRYRDNPTYEGGLVSGLTRHVAQGARIVIVGTGIGVTLVIAARLAGKGGSVTAYEGSAKSIRLTRETITRNNLSTEISVIHAIVGEDISVYGSGPSAPVIPAVDLPDCDLLELDCEGAELKILREMRIRPRVILVETHGMLGAQTERVRDLLAGIGYEVTDLGVAEPGRSAFCLEHDIRVLCAELKTQAD